MKTIKIYAKFLAILFIIVACNKKDLDVTSTRQLATTYYEFDDHVQNAVNAAYAPLQQEINHWGVNTWLWGSMAASDDVWAGGADNNDRPGYHESNYHTMSANDGDFVNLWIYFFQGINRCNTIIANVKPESGAKKNAIGQAKFLCAFYYFYLARMMGGMPLISSVPETSAKYSRATIDATYTFIENLLKDATTVGMQTRTGNSDPGNGLATLGSAQALLGKVYMYHASYIDESGNLVVNKNYYNLAIPYLAAVADDNSGYLLDPNYSHVFFANNSHGVESVFEINFTQAVGGGGAQGNALATLCGPRPTVLNQICDSINWGWGFNQPTKELKNLFLSNNDSVRMNTTILDTAILQKLHNAFIKKVDKLSWVNCTDGFYGGKSYTDPRFFQNWTESTKPQIILRLADIYLLLAEALVQSGTIANGHDAAYYVNLVRKRAHLPEKSSVTLDDIKLERHLELALEGDHYFDLVRWGDASSKLVAKPDNGVLSWDEGLPGKSSHGLWPIPYSELVRTIGSSQIAQNPGY